MRHLLLGTGTCANNTCVAHEATARAQYVVHEGTLRTRTVVSCHHHHLYTRKTRTEETDIPTRLDESLKMLPRAPLPHNTLELLTRTLHDPSGDDRYIAGENCCRVHERQPCRYQ